MKNCIKCGHEIEEDSNFCMYCGSNQVDTDSLTDKSEKGPKQPSFEGKPTFTSEKEPDNEASFYESDKTQDTSSEAAKEPNTTIDKTKPTKKMWLIAGIVVFVSAIIIGLCAVSPLIFDKKKDNSENSSPEDSITTEAVETTEKPDNSVNGKGYYYFDNALNENTIEKFIYAFDNDHSLEKLGLGISSIDDFVYTAEGTLLGEKITEYDYTDFNGKTQIAMFINENKKVVAFCFSYLASMLNDPTTNDNYKTKQIHERPASWLYALSNTLSYDQAYSIYRNMQHNSIENSAKNNLLCGYSQGYSTLKYSSNNSEVVNTIVIKTDSDFIEKNNIKSFEDLFQAVNTDENSDSSSADKETEEETSNLEPVAASDSDGRASFGSYSLELPNNWMYNITDDGVYFYEKYNYSHEETGSTGLLCSIKSTSNSVEKETSESINASLLGSKYGMNYFVYHPTGIGIIEDEVAQQKYHDALREVNDVMETFQFE